MSDSARLGLVHRHSNDPGRRQALGPYVIEALLDRYEEGAGTAYRVHIAPGQRTGVSYHRVAEEFYFVLAGTGVALLDGREHPLLAGDFLRLPPGTTHGFVAGAGGLDLLDIHVPGCRPDHDVYFVGDIPDGFGTGEGEPPG
jgi:mannose-6-phosphate isomerase-like protein (cupin superfamily)